MKMLRDVAVRAKRMDHGVRRPIFSLIGDLDRTAYDGKSQIPTVMETITNYEWSTNLNRDYRDIRVHCGRAAVKAYPPIYLAVSERTFAALVACDQVGDDSDEPPIDGIPWPMHWWHVLEVCSDPSLSGRGFGS
jgi:hypothetical protein